MKKLVSLVLSLSLVLTMIPQLAFAGEPGEYEGKTVVIYTGNLRGDVDVYPKVANAKKDFAAKGADVYLVDAGNHLQGSTYADSTRGRAIYELMDAAGYDVAAMGAYDFAYEEASTGQKYHGNFTKYHTQKMLYRGQEEMEYNKNMPGSSKGTLAKVDAPKFKVISSNISGESSVNVDNASAISNPEQLYAFDANAKLKAEGINALTVGFEALTDEAVPDMLQDGYFNGLEFREQPSAPQGQDLNVTVGLSNNGEEVPYADFTVKAPTGGEKVIGAYEIDNETEVSEEIKGFDYSSYDDDADVLELANIVKDEAKSVIAKSDIDLIGKNSLHRSQETTMGDLVTDALLWYAQNAFEGFEDENVPIVAIQNGGNIRQTLFSGEITDLDLFHSYPYSPSGIGILYVTGEQLLESLEEANYDNPSNAFPHVAGMTYNIDLHEEYDASMTKGENGDGKYGKYDLADSYNRVSITSVGGKAFDPKATYAVVADNMVIANGLDTYGTFMFAKNGGAKYINNGNGILVRDVVAQYLQFRCKKKVPAKYAETQGRITFGESSYKKAKAAADAAKSDDPDKYLAAAEKLVKEAEITCNPDKKAEAEKYVSDAKESVKRAEEKKAAEEAAKKKADEEAAKKKAAEEAAKKKAAEEAAMKKVKTVTVNVKIVNAKALAKAVKKAKGSSKYVTKFVLGKKVKKIAKNAFKEYKKVTTLQIKTKKLKKKAVKGSLKGSKIKKIQVKVGSKKVNKKYVKKWLFDNMCG